jgi:glutamate dehydrogenase (NAD(P)+)
LSLSVLECPQWGLLGWLSVASETQGLAFGGTRVSGGVTEEEVVALSWNMHHKLLPVGLPTGGAKAGLRVDPGDPMLLEKARAFGEQARPLLSTRVVLGKDMGATDEVMEAIYAGAGIPQLFLGKARGASCPDRIGELAGYRPHMTGLGVAWAARAAMEEGMDGARVLVQGWGVVGRGSAIRVEELGATVVGHSDVHGATVGEMPLERDALLGLEADVLVLAASSGSVDAALAQTISAPLVVEGANLALTEDARQVLYARGIEVVPDCIASCSSASLVASQLAAGNDGEPAEIWARIEAGIEASIREARALGAQDGIPMREAFLRNWG